MTTALRALLATTLLSLLAAAPTAAQPSLWLVDDDNPADFSDLQTAIDSAAPGDVLRIAPGSYAGPFTIDKGLTILTVLGVTLHTAATFGTGEPTLLVTDLPADQALVYHGGQIFNGNTNGPAAIHVRDCAGAVWFQDVFVDSYGAEALRVTDSASVVLNVTRLQTNLIAAAPDGTPQSGSGARLDGGTLHLHDSDLIGSHGLFQIPGLPTPTGPAIGGSGLTVLDGTARVLGGSLSGSSGGSFLLDGCLLGGDGGHGVELPAGPGTPVALLRDTDASGGSGGNFDDTCAPAPAPGRDVDASGGTALVDATPARHLYVPSQAHAGDGFTIAVDAQPGDMLWFFTALRPDVGAPVAGVQMHLDSNSLTQLLVIPASPGGPLSLPVLLPDLPAGFEVLPVPLQVFAVDNRGGRHETGPAQIVVL